MEAREIFIAVKQKIRFQQAEKEKDSHYTILGNTLVRISNHCTWMKAWENYLNEHPKCQKMNILSLVFEDNGDTFCEECLFTVQPRNIPIRVTEYVYKSSFIDKNIAKQIIKSLQDMDYTNQYIEPTHSVQPQIRISKNPPTNESKNYNNMKKNVQRINESQLRAIVAESVKRVLKEAYVNNVPNNWKPTEFKGTYQDEDGGIYMPDDDLEGYEYMIVTYSGEEIVGKTKVLLPRPGLNAYDDEVPFTLGSNQALIELD